MNILTSNELRTGDVLHCKGHRLLSKAISFFTKSPITHSAVVIECWGQIYVVDAQKNGVNPKPLKAWLEEYKYDIYVSRPKIGPKDPKTFSIKAFSKVGLIGYDFESLLWKFPISILTGKWGKDKDPNEDKMVCSEYVAWLWQIERSYRITPKRLHELLQRSSFLQFKFGY